MTAHEIPYKEKQPEKWFFRMDLKGGLRRAPNIATRKFKMPFSHKDWCGPFNCEADAVDAAQDAFGIFITTPAVNRREFPI